MYREIVQEIVASIVVGLLLVVAYKVFQKIQTY